ncbi:MAG: hypothetical protein R3B13_03180 [Polyangiaceae bacterium]
MTPRIFRLGIGFGTALALSLAGCTPTSKSSSSAQTTESTPTPTQKAEPNGSGTASATPAPTALTNRCWDATSVRAITLETVEHGVPVKRTLDLDSKVLSGSKGTPQGDTEAVQRTVSDAERERARTVLHTACFAERTETQSLPASKREDWLHLRTDGGTITAARTKAVVPQGTHYLVLSDDEFARLLSSLPSP